jgi:hypothetical protein
VLWREVNAMRRNDFVFFGGDEDEDGDNNGHG